MCYRVVAAKLLPMLQLELYFLDLVRQNRLLLAGFFHPLVPLLPIRLQLPPRQIPSLPPLVAVVEDSQVLPLVLDLGSVAMIRSAQVTRSALRHPQTHSRLLRIHLLRVAHLILSKHLQILLVALCRPRSQHRNLNVQAPPLQVEASISWIFEWTIVDEYDKF